MDQQTITAPSGRTYQWSKPTPPTAEDWKALQDYDASLGPAKPAKAEQEPFNPPRLSQPRVGSNREDSVRFTPKQVETVRENAPTILGATAAGLTGGASIPIQIAAAAGGGAVGRLIKDSNDSMSAGERLSNAVTSGAIQGAVQYGGAKIPEAVGNIGKAVYRGYLKPSLAGTEIAKAKEIVDTAIREWLPITQGGVDKAKILVSRINKEVDQHLRNAQAGKPLDLTKIADKVRNFARSMYNRPGAPSEDLASALKVADQIDQHASIGYAPAAAGKIANPAEVTSLQVNQTKQALDRAVGDTGFGVERNAATEARKIGRHAARVDIEEAVPAVAGLNKRESQIIDAIEALTKAVGRESNKNQFTGVSTLASLGTGAGAGAASGSPIAAIVAAVAAKVALSPEVASRGAILAARFAKVPGTSVAQAVRMGVFIARSELGEKRE